MAGRRAVVVAIFMKHSTIQIRSKRLASDSGSCEKTEIRVDYRGMKFGSGPAVKDWKEGLGTAEVSPNENGPATFAQPFAPVREVRLPYRPARPLFSQYAWAKR